MLQVIGPDASSGARGLVNFRGGPDRNHDQVSWK
jgi:hypothetical protein